VAGRLSELNEETAKVHLNSAMCLLYYSLEVSLEIEFQAEAIVGRSDPMLRACASKVLGYHKGDSHVHTHICGIKDFDREATALNRLKDTAPDLCGLPPDLSPVRRSARLTAHPSGLSPFSTTRSPSRAHILALQDIL
jgi:hypothetical protein